MAKQLYLNMAYCDYIAHTIIRPAALAELVCEHSLIAEVGNVKMDLHKEGYMVSTTKRLQVTDINGKKYRITVEEM
jgi:hypothetical protein|tara:strand:- start:895 stop:1122 length:228 start_codon:yes stop_codon:yes gene_type:complete